MVNKGQHHEGEQMSHPAIDLIENGSYQKGG
jgi:hypothetical protein